MVAIYHVAISPVPVKRPSAGLAEHSDNRTDCFACGCVVPLLDRRVKDLFRQNEIASVEVADPHLDPQAGSGKRKPLRSSA